MDSQDVRQQLARAAAHVHDRAKAREVVGIQHRHGDDSCECSHCLDLDGGLLRVGGVVVEERHSEDPLGGRFAGLHRAEQIRPAAPAHLSGEEEHDSVERPGDATAEEFPDGCERKAVRLLLRKDPQGRERAQEPAQRGRVGLRGRCQLGAAHWSHRQVVGNPELDRDVERLRAPQTHAEVTHYKG